MDIGRVFTGGTGEDLDGEQLAGEFFRDRFVDAAHAAAAARLIEEVVADFFGHKKHVLAVTARHKLQWLQVLQLHGFIA